MKAFVLASVLLVVAQVAQAQTPVKIGDTCKVGAMGVQFGTDATGRALKCNPTSLKYEDMPTSGNTDATLTELVKLNATSQQILMQQIESNKVQNQILKEMIATRQKEKQE